MKAEPFSQYQKDFAKETTQRTYYYAIRKFLQSVYGDDVSDRKDVDDFSVKYLEEKDADDFERDLKRFIASIKDKSSKTKYGYANAVKVWGEQYGKITDADWKKIRRRKLETAFPEHRDKILTKKQLRRVLSHIPPKGKSLFLFLASSGTRIGEALQLKEDDLYLDEDPPRAFLKKSYTKGKNPGRDVLFSYEARDAITEWLEIKSDIQKKGYTKEEDGTITIFGKPTDFEEIPTYGDNKKVWDYSHSTAQSMWVRALEKVGLDEKDNGRYIYHIHTLRKFFRTNWSSTNEDVRKALMGHLTGLDKAYWRGNLDEKRREYLQSMNSLSVYGGSVEQVEMRRESVIEALKAVLQTRGIPTAVIDTIVDRVAQEIVGEKGIGLEDLELGELTVDQFDKLRDQISETVSVATARKMEIDALRNNLLAEGVPEIEIDKICDAWADEVLSGMKPEEKVMPRLLGEPFTFVNLGTITEDEFEDLKQRLIAATEEASKGE